jgi:hypothetical protein
MDGAIAFDITGVTGLDAAFRALLSSRAKPSARWKKFEAAQELAHKRYGRAFRKLAE